jgi:hypothetical protein
MHRKEDLGGSEGIHAEVLSRLQGYASVWTQGKILELHFWNSWHRIEDIAKTVCAEKDCYLNTRREKGP